MTRTRAITAISQTTTNTTLLAVPSARVETREWELVAGCRRAGDDRARTAKVWEVGYRARRALNADDLPQVQSLVRDIAARLLLEARREKRQLAAESGRASDVPVPTAKVGEARGGRLQGPTGPELK